MIDEQPERAADGGSTEESGSPTEEGPVNQLPIVTPLIATQAEGPAPEEHAIDEYLMRRIEHLPREAGWALITAGVIGVIAPGIVGAPFLVAGAIVLTPGGPRALSRWAGRKPRKRAHSALRQICRFIDDLERRYPRRPNARTDAPRVAPARRGHLDVQ